MNVIEIAVGLLIFAGVANLVWLGFVLAEIARVADNDERIRQDLERKADRVSRLQLGIRRRVRQMAERPQ